MNHKSAGVFRRSAAEALCWFDTIGEDFAWSAALGTQGNIAYVPQPLFEYRLHATNTIRDLTQPWHYSLEALKGLEALPAKISFPRELAHEWRDLLAACRRALPFYYLQAALRLQGERDAKKFLQAIAPELALEEQSAARRFLRLAGWWPRWAHRAGFAVYTRLPGLQSIAQKLLRH